MDIIKLTALDRYAHRNLLHRNVFGRTNYRCAFLLCFKQSYKIGIYLSRGNAQKVLFAVGTQCKILIIIRPTLGYRCLFDVFYHSFPFKRHSAVYLCLCLPPPKHLLSLLCLTPPFFAAPAFHRNNRRKGRSQYNRTAYDHDIGRTVFFYDFFNGKNTIVVQLKHNVFTVTLEFALSPTGIGQYAQLAILFRETAHDVRAFAGLRVENANAESRCRNSFAKPVF